MLGISKKKIIYVILVGHLIDEPNQHRVEYFQTQLVQLCNLKIAFTTSWLARVQHNDDNFSLILITTCTLSPNWGIK